MPRIIYPQEIQALRDASNRAAAKEHELRVRIRELEVERDQAVSRAARVTGERDAYQAACLGLVRLVALLDSGKSIL